MSCILNPINLPESFHVVNKLAVRYLLSVSWHDFLNFLDAWRIWYLRVTRDLLPRPNTLHIQNSTIYEDAATDVFPLFPSHRCRCRSSIDDHLLSLGRGTQLSGRMDQCQQRCRDVDVPSIYNVCKDWRNGRGHFGTYNQPKRCLKRTGSDFDVGPCAGNGGRCSRQWWDEVSCTW